VYDGSPTPVTGFMATGVKAAGFLALVRLLHVAFPAATEAWQPIIAALAIASMVLGNLVALSQRSLKRMLAYSSIAHAGYLLVAVWPATMPGAAATLLYLGAYALTTLAAFALLSVLGRDGEREVTLESIAGLGRQRPWIAFALAVCMLSLLGFPGTLGFVGKWAILSAVVDAGQLPLAVILAVTSLVSAGYYLPVIMSSYMREPGGAEAHAGVLLPRAAAAAVGVAIALVLLFGVLPAAALSSVTASAGTLLQGAAGAIAGAVR
jgi:NADH-quinone oxidoreductase subunit N